MRKPAITFHRNMLEDRDYMRDSPRRLAWSMTAIVAVVLVAAFLLQTINRSFIHSNIEYWLMLTPEGLSHACLWQLITFQFLHATLWHLAFNLFALWCFGTFVENVLGKSRFLVALLGCGVLGGMLQGSLMMLFPRWYGFPVLGASAGISGLIAIFVMIDPHAQIRLQLVLPVKAIYFLWLSLAVSLFFTIFPAGSDNVAYASHLGGMLAGIAWVKLGWHHDYIRLPWEGMLANWRQWEPFHRRRRKRELVRAASVKLGKWPPAPSEPVADPPPEEFISREVDPILDKISAHGIQSLTDRERKILESARKRMGRRQGL
jgi:membrane associated rhomboid family serine protease